MKKEKDIYKEYIKYNFNRPWFFGKDQHWKTYHEGYEMGYEDAAKESLDSVVKVLGIDLKNFPTNTDQQFMVMREALHKYYMEQK